MSPLDARKPAQVTADFHSRLAEQLAAHGFTTVKGALVRRRRGGSHRILLASSHYNAPGNVACFVSLRVEDQGIRKLDDTWRAQRSLLRPDEEVRTNIADPAVAAMLATRIRDELPFFDLAEDPYRLLTELRRRYVAGFVEPGVVVPYLRSRLGHEAIVKYAEALLAGRPELWPAFGSAEGLTSAPNAKPGVTMDHGTDLAVMLARHANQTRMRRPEDVVDSSNLAAANLRCFFGRQLRAFGEPDAAALLRRVRDERVLALREAQLRTPENIVDSAAIATPVLHEVTGEERPPRRMKAIPRLFQYHELHAPWGEVAS